MCEIVVVCTKGSRRRKRRKSMWREEAGEGKLKRSAAKNPRKAEGNKYQKRKKNESK